MRFPLLPHLGIGDVDIDFEHARSLDMYKYVDSGSWSYEPDVLAVLLELLNASPRARFINIGANMGYFSLLAKKLFGQRVDVFAYEPMPELVERIGTALTRNGLDIEVSDVALSDFEGSAPFHLSAKSDTSNSLNPDFRPSKDVIDVPVSTLDAQFPAPDSLRPSGVDHQSVELPTVLLVDTESTEPAVLRGGRQFVERVQPAIICEVLAGRTETQLSEFVDEFGYRSFALTDDGPQLRDEVVGDRTYQHRDWLFLPADAPAIDRVGFRSTLAALTRQD